MFEINVNKHDGGGGGAAGAAGPTRVWGSNEPSSRKLKLVLGAQTE